MATVEVYSLSPGAAPETVGVIEPSTDRLRVGFLFQADKSDPLNQQVVAHLVVNERFGLKVTVDRTIGGGAEGDAVKALVAAVIEHHAEIRDALAEKG